MDDSGTIKLITAFANGTLVTAEHPCTGSVHLAEILFTEADHDDWRNANGKRTYSPDEVRQVRGKPATMALYTKG